MTNTVSENLREFLSQKEAALAIGVGIGVAATLLVMNRDKLREQIRQTISRIKDGKPI